MPEHLVNHLLSKVTSEEYRRCVKHPFLRAARDGSLDKDRLALWLSQDRIYAAHAYPRFIAGLIAKIPFSSHHGIGSREENKTRHILGILTFCLQNVVREADFFVNSAREYNLDIEKWKERPATRSYTAEMSRISTWGTLEEGLVFLWAMEKIYLDSWCFVAERGKARLISGKDTSNSEKTDNATVSDMNADASLLEQYKALSDTGQSYDQRAENLKLDFGKTSPDSMIDTIEISELQNEGTREERKAEVVRNGDHANASESMRAIEAFAENWSNTEFVNFVNSLKELVATLDIPQNSDLWTRCNAAWDRVIELEYDFWP